MPRLSSLSRSLMIGLVGVVGLAGLAGCGDNANGAPPDAPPPANRGFAVVNSDFTSTSISLLSSDTGQVVNGDCINSGTRAPGATLALSGDVSLPSWSQPGNLVVAIDRTNSVLTWIDPSNCTPLRQLDVSTKFFANPHDVIGVSATKAYVTRYERNTKPTADPNDRDDGDDILIIDPSVPAITGRIDLSTYAVQVTGATIQARPSRARLIDGKLYVSLDNLSGDFAAAGHGRIVVIDAATDQVTGMIEVPDLKSCSGLSYIDTSKTLIVTCNGVFSDADIAAGSGIVYLNLGVSPPVETHRVAATPFAGRALAAFSGIGRDGALGLAVTTGEFSGTPKDQLWSFDAAGGTATKLADAKTSFTYGTVLIDPAHDRAFLTDADADEPRVRIYSFADGAAPTLQTSVDANPTVGLPPREMTWY